MVCTHLILYFCNSIFFPYSLHLSYTAFYFSSLLVFFFTVNIVNILDVLVLIPPIQVVLSILLHVPLGIGTFSFHCTSCMCT